MAQLFTTPYQTTLDANGKPISGAQLFFYDTGTLNHRDVYTTSALSTPHSSPIVADAAGRYPAVYLNSSFVYRVIVCDSFGTPIKDVDPYSIFDAIRTDLISSIGSSLVGAVQNITLPSTRTLAQVLYDAPLKLEDKGGGPGKTAAQNDAAFLALFANADSGLRGTIQLLEGTYQISAPIRAATFDRLMSIKGMGPGRTIIQQTNANLNCIELPTGLNHSILIKGMTLQGAGSGTSYSGTGMGIYQAPTVGNDSFNIRFRNLLLSNFGGDCINLGRSFTVDMYAVGCSLSGGNGIVGGNNTWKLDSCYAHTLPGVGAVGYKLQGNSVTLINCNGVDQLEQWGRFGTSVTDGDAADGYANVLLIGCNVENFSKIGVELRNGTITILGSTFTSGAGFVNQQAMRLRQQTTAGIFDGSSRIALGAGSTWLNGYGVHTATASPTPIPFGTMLGLLTSNTTGFAYWNDAAADVAYFSGDNIATASYGQIAKAFSNLVVQNAFQSLGTLGYGTGAGGVVTQLTSKATGVTLNKASGAVTLINAALAATTSVGFTLTNSTIAATDVVLVSIKSGASADSYTVTVDNVTAGTCRISLRNLTAAPLSEAVVLNFVVIKGVTA